MGLGHPIDGPIHVIPMRDNYFILNDILQNSPASYSHSIVPGGFDVTS